MPTCARLKTRTSQFEHLLTMSHGLLWDESNSWDDPANNERQMLEAKDPYRYVMEQPMAVPPGELFNYCGGATSLLGSALVKGVGRGIDAYAGERLFWTACNQRF